MKLENFEILKFFAMFYTLYHTCIFKQESIQGRGMINGRHLALYQIFKTTVFTTKYMINIDILLIWSTIKNLEPKIILFMPLKKHILHLYDHIRQPCYSAEAKELTCPKPTVPKKEIYLTNQDQRGKEKGLFLILLFFYWPEAIHMTFHFLTYWLAKSNFCAISICYLDVNWLIPKILACRTRIWSLLASERSERVTSFIFCRAGWYFSVSIIFTFRWHIYHP